MDLVNPIVNLFSRLWDCLATRTRYIRKLQENHNSLRDAMNGLKHQKNDVKAKVVLAEGQQLRPKEEVLFWIQSVEDLEGQVNEILEKATQQISNKCLGGCRPKNCWSSYKVGKRVAKKLTTVDELRSKGNFSDVADMLPPADVEEMPSRPTTVGMDSMFENVWRCLKEEDQVGIMGIYGMGGVGKTTLLKKINNEFLRQGDPDSSVVIWITVSKDYNVRRVQTDIGNRLGLSFPEDASQDLRASRILNALRKKKFVLLLDDIWDRVDFEAVGIPSPNSENKSKVIFTTRSEALCGLMEAQEKIRVECLGWDKAWDLFQKMVGEEALNSHIEIPKLAKVVAKECAGLPLALNTIGRTMASKKTPHEWNRAITILRKSASEFSGMGDKVLPLLKFSYDSLANGMIKSCFLYCSLYPEDYDINKEELIEHWVGEGFITEFDDMNEALYQGHDIIGTLKLACLLESGYDEDLQVKMHDVIRDLALWIACECGRKKDKFFVQAGIGLNEAPEVKKWEEAERVSVMYNDIRALTETPMCLNLITLLLNNNQRLERISAGFFKSMTGLRVLDLSGAAISEFPMEIVKLVELQYLNLSCTHIETLPEELVNLVKLEYLNLRNTKELTIPFKLISRLPRLQVLNLYTDSFLNYERVSWEGDGDGASLGELECLKHLKVLGITIFTVADLQRLFNSHKLSRCTNNLCISECRGLTSIPPSPLSSSSTPTLGNMKCLNELWFDKCLDLEELTISWIVTGEGENGFSSSLETLYLWNMPDLNMVRAVPHHPCFQKLSFVSIYNCAALKDLTWLRAAQSLQTLKLHSCNRIEEVICGGDAAVEEFITFSRLETINFLNLPKLKSIYRHGLPFPSLEVIRIRDCPELKKLPLDANSAERTLKEISGETKWWDELEWENESIKAVFLPYFNEEF